MISPSLIPPSNTYTPNAPSDTPSSLASMPFVAVKASLVQGIDANKSARKPYMHP